MEAGVSSGGEFRERVLVESGFWVGVLEGEGGGKVEGWMRLGVLFEDPLVGQGSEYG